MKGQSRVDMDISAWHQSKEASQYFVLLLIFRLLSAVIFYVHSCSEA
jgi:hypothetical protein